MKTLALAVTMIVGISSASAQTLRAQAEASNKAADAAIKKKDFVALEKSMRATTTADFVYQESGQPGKGQTLQEMIGHMKIGISAMTKVTIATTNILTLKEKGNTATGTTRHRVGGTVVGPDKKTSKMVYVGITSDTYVKEGGTWKLSKMIWKTESMTMNGKSIMAPTPAPRTKIERLTRARHIAE